MPREFRFPRSAPPIALAESPLRGAPPATLLAVVTAVRDGRALRARYQSFSTPGPGIRALEPHARVFDGFRWRARARDVEEDRVSGTSSWAG